MIREQQIRAQLAAAQQAQAQAAAAAGWMTAKGWVPPLLPCSVKYLTGDFDTLDDQLAIHHVKFSKYIAEN